MFTDVNIRITVRNVDSKILFGFKIYELSVQNVHVEHRPLPTTTGTSARLILWEQLNLMCIGSRTRYHENYRNPLSSSRFFLGLIEH